MSLDAVWRRCAVAETLRRTPVPLPARVDRLLIVGASCAGKTTLGRAVRKSTAVRAGYACLPMRYVTRPKRANDCALENRHCSLEEFEGLVTRGEIAMHWTRALEAGRAVRYGFGPADPGMLPIYSANNALLAAGAPWMNQALIVAVHAPVAVRRARLERRSPDLLAGRPAEAAFRLSERSTGILASVHVVVENHGPHERTAPVEFTGLVEALASRHAAAIPRGS